MARAKLLTLLMIISMPAAVAAGDSAGVWRLRLSNPDGAADKPVHFVITKQEGKTGVSYYDETWRLQEFILEEEKDNAVKARSEARARAISLEMIRDGEKCAGTVKFLHAQYPLSFSFTGFRVIADRAWEPLEGPRRYEDPDHLVDLNKVLIEKASKTSFGKFVKAFESEVAPDFYCFLSDQLWGDAGLIHPKVKELFELVRRPEFKEAAANFRQLRKELVEQVKKELPAFSTGNMTLAMPSVKGFSIQTQLVGTIPLVFARVGPSEKGLKEEDRLKWQILHEAIRLPLYNHFPPTAGGMAGEMIREGISGYLAASLLKLKVEDVVGVSSACIEESSPRLGPHRQTIRRHVMGDKQSAVKKLSDPTMSAEQIVQLLSFKFGEQLAGRFKPEEILGLGRARLLEMLMGYLKTA